MSSSSLTIAKPTNRSRITNGSELLAGIDGRSALARRYRDLVDALSAQLGGHLSEAEHLQVRGAAGLQVHVEQLTAAMVRGEAVDLEALTRASNSASRALAVLKRGRPAPKAPTGPAGLRTYLETKGRAA